MCDVVFGGVFVRLAFLDKHPERAKVKVPIYSFTRARLACILRGAVALREVISTAIQPHRNTIDRHHEIMDPPQIPSQDQPDDGLNRINSI